MVVHGSLGQGAAGIHHMLGIDDFRLVTEADDPAQEHGGHGHIHQEGEVVVPIGV